MLILLHNSYGRWHSIRVGGVRISWQRNSMKYVLFSFMLMIITPAGINLPVSGHLEGFVHSGRAFSGVLSAKCMKYSTKWNGFVLLEKCFQEFNFTQFVQVNFCDGLW